MGSSRRAQRAKRVGPDAADLSGRSGRPSPTRLVACFALVLVACTNNPAGPGGAAANDPVASIGLSPSSMTLTTAEFGTLQAEVKDAYGNPLSPHLTWSSSDTTVATVDDTGLVSSVAAGQATIEASADGVTGTASIVVQADTTAGASSGTAVTSVTVSPAADTLVVGGSVTLTAVPKDSTGNTVYGIPITWTSSDTTIATVDAGQVNAVRVGSATIIAQADSVRGTATVVVQ